MTVGGAVLHRAPSMSGEATRTRMGIRTASDRGAYLLVVRDDSSFVFQLPRGGVVTIGRAPEVDLRLDHPSVSRKHATLAISDGQLSITDHGSHNGTRVNGELIAEPRTLASGDIATVGDVACVVHIAEPAMPGHTIHAEGAWRRRLAEELERVVAFRRTLGVLVLASAALPKLSQALRLIDVVGTTTSGELLILVPEADRAEVRATVARIHGVAPSVAVGLAMCPEDACDVDAALFAARAAVGRATVGTVVEAGDAATRISIGDREVVIADPAMIKVYALIERLAPSPIPVLILGESGVGKEYAAAAVHHGSGRTGPFVAVNCAAFTQSLVESELFGHDKGAFTGATAAKPGLFEAAHGGTLFLDELAELPPAVQANLLRVLETKLVTRIGETTERPVDVRLVAATLRDLTKEVAEGRFRQDLYFRLGGATVIVPPLRDRRAEIPALARELLRVACVQAKRPALAITPAAMQVLLMHTWPGNIRELRNAMQYVAATAPDDRVEVADLPPPLDADEPVEPAPVTRAETAGGFRPIGEELRELERKRMTEALAAAGGVKTRAAALIDMPIRTFNFKLRQYKL